MEIYRIYEEEKKKLQEMNLTPQEYEGLYDKNNTPIYEGDLIKYACGGTEDYVIQEIDEVFFNNEYGTFEIAINKNKENSEVLGFWLADLYEDSFYQVIGNIYDK